MSALLQTLTYILRALNISLPTSRNLYIAWFVLLMIAPIWTNAYVYVVFGRITRERKSSEALERVLAWKHGLTFVILDVIAFLVQVSGAGIAASSAVAQNLDQTRANMGIHIYMGGCGFQQICIIAFFALAVRVQIRLTADAKTSGIKVTRTRTLFCVIYAVGVLITVRIIFRLVEYSQGFKSSIPKHEVFQYSLDSTPMLFALIAFNVWHPGRLLNRHEKRYAETELLPASDVWDERVV